MEGGYLVVEIYTDQVQAEISYPEGCEGDIYAGSKIYADLELEEKVHISFDVKIIGKGKVKIGRGTAVAPNTVVFTSRPEMKSGGKNSYCEEHEPKVGKVVIGENVFIGSNCVIGHDVEIADGVVIGANSIVKDDISEPGTFWCGNPARKAGDVQGDSD